MGYNTSMIILNDGLHEIAKDKDFGKKVEQAALKLHRNEGGVDISSGCHANAATVIETHHADMTSVIAIGGNCATVLKTVGGWKHNEEEAQIRILKELADKYGYSLRKKPKKK